MTLNITSSLIQLWQPSRRMCVQPTLAYHRLNSLTGGTALESHRYHLQPIIIYNEKTNVVHYYIEQKLSSWGWTYMSEVELPWTAGLTVQHVCVCKLLHQTVLISKQTTEIVGGGRGRKGKGREEEGRREEVYLLLVQNVHRRPCTATIIAWNDNHFQNTISICMNSESHFISFPKHLHQLPNHTHTTSFLTHVCKWQISNDSHISQQWRYVHLIFGRRKFPCLWSDKNMSK